MIPMSDQIQQRAHANYQEHLPNFLVYLFVAGLRYPEISAAMGFSWCVARTMYAMGYTRKDNNEKGNGRYFGIWWYVPHLGLLALSAWSAFQIATGQ